MYEKLTGVSPSRWFSIVKNLGLDKDGTAKLKDWHVQQQSVIELKKIGEATIKYLEEQASIRQNAPFVQIQGIGYVEVPADIVVKLDQPGVVLGTGFGVNAAVDALRYLNRYGLTLEDSPNVLWAGSAKEAVLRIQNAEAKNKFDQPKK